MLANVDASEVLGLFFKTWSCMSTSTFRVYDTVLPASFYGIIGMRGTGIVHVVVYNPLLG